MIDGLTPERIAAAREKARERIFDAWCGCSTTPEHDWGQCTDVAHKRVDALTRFERAEALYAADHTDGDYCTIYVCEYRTGLLAAIEEIEGG